MIGDRTQFSLFISLGELTFYCGNLLNTYIFLPTGQSSSHANPLALGEVSKNAGPPSDPVAVGPTDARDFSWLREKPSQGMEPSDRISHFSNLPYPGFSGPTASSNPLSTLPGVDFAKATSLAALPWRQPLTGLGPVNAFPPFNRYTAAKCSESSMSKFRNYLKMAVEL